MYLHGAQKSNLLKADFQKAEVLVEAKLYKLYQEFDFSILNIEVKILLKNSE